MRTLFDSRTLGVLTVLLAAVVARAEPIAGTHGLRSFGQFQGTVTYEASDAGHAILTVVLTNTSPGGYLTAFAMNDPGDRIDGIALIASDADFHLYGGSHSNDGIVGRPFGRFDFGAGIGRRFHSEILDPTEGIASGDSATFAFHLEGVGLDQIDAMSFLNERSEEPGDWAGHTAFMARFRNDECERPRGDRVPMDPIQPVPEPVETPEPATLALAGVGAACLLGFRLHRRRSG